MANPKPLPCPRCHAAGETLAVYRYEHGWRHVECDACGYLGPGEGNNRQAVLSHNERASGAAGQSSTPHPTR